MHLCPMPNTDWPTDPAHLCTDTVPSPKTPNAPACAAGRHHRALRWLQFGKKQTKKHTAFSHINPRKILSMRPPVSQQNQLTQHNVTADQWTLHLANNNGHAGQFRFVFVHRNGAVRKHRRYMLQRGHFRF